MYVVLNNESENKSHQLCCDKLTLLSLICDTHEMNTQKTNLGYIELLIYRSIYSGPMDFDISEFYCILKYITLYMKIKTDAK